LHNFLLRQINKREIHLQMVQNFTTFVSNKKQTNKSQKHCLILTKKKSFYPKKTFFFQNKPNFCFAHNQKYQK